MKRLIKNLLGGTLLLSVLGLYACRDKTDNASLKKDVLSLHDQVMNDDGKAMDDKMTLDSVDKKMPMPGDSAKILSSQLGKLSDSMMDWMHKFDPEKSRTDEETTTYFSNQKKQLLKLDSSYKALLKTSAGYIKKCNIKTGDKMQGMKM